MSGVSLMGDCISVQIISSSALYTRLAFQKLHWRK